MRGGGHLAKRGKATPRISCRSAVEAGARNVQRYVKVTSCTSSLRRLIATGQVRAACSRMLR